VALTPGLVKLLGKPLTYDQVSEAARARTGLPDCARPSAQTEIASDSNVQLAGRDFSGGFSAADAEIVDHYSSGLALADDTGLIAPLSLLQSLYNTQSVTYMALYLRPGVSVHPYLKQITERLRAAGLDLSLYPYDTEEMSLFYVGVMNFLFAMAAFFVLLVFGVVALSIINAQTMSVIERSREIGTLRSIGYSRQFVAGSMALETLLLAVLSLIAGLATAISIIAAVNRLNFRFTPPGIAGDMQFMLNLSAPLGLILAVAILALACETSRRTALARTQQRVFELMISSTG
jgi:putative ABC transport system permease protein